jgi:hypothetical protein
VGTELLAVDPPGHDALWVNADQRPRPADRLSAASHLYPARSPRTCAGEVVDDDGGAAGSFHVAKLPHLLEVETADVDRVVLGVVAPADRDDVWGAVLADGRQAAEGDEVVELGEQVVELGFAERTRDVSFRSAELGRRPLLRHAVDVEVDLLVVEGH